jgi:magnesium chelatase subunit D
MAGATRKIQNYKIYWLVNNEIAELDIPLFRGLVAAALNPGLRSIIIFDATTATLNLAAQNLALMMAEVDCCTVTTIQLGVIETEEDLWGQYSLQQGKIAWQPGLLAQGKERELRLLVVPDLTKLNTATARACIALIGSESASLERHGKQERWQPNLCWLVGCPTTSEELGSLSPHLLDRFALRLSKGSIEPLMRATPDDLAERIRSLRLRLDEESPVPIEALSPELSSRLQAAKQVRSIVTFAATGRVTEYFSINENYSVRRELALLRLAAALAQLEGKEEVDRSDVDLAAKTIGLKISYTPKARESKTPDDAPIADPATPRTDDRQQPPSTLKQPELVSEKEPVSKSDSEWKSPERDMPIEYRIGDPYREDDVPVQREAASLQLPFRRLRNMGRGYGEIIGVEPASRLEDISIVSTLFEAAKYQNIRGRGTTAPDRLILTPTDLRKYRRGILPEQMLLMLVDYTSVTDTKWQDALLPYLQWAYVERANVCLVRVGAQNAKPELQADRIITKKVLVKQIDDSLKTESGMATPLAHGLDLSLKTLRRALQHGRNKLEQVVMVVISDGRGNVPLIASQGGKLDLPVGRKGIEDALAVARQIAELKGVKKIVLNPQPKYYSDLPIQLALALGAKIDDISPLKPWEDIDVR